MNIIRFLRRKTEIPFVYDYKTVAQTMRFMRSHGCTRIPIISQDGLYRGALDEGDILWYIMDCNGFEFCRDHKVGDMVNPHKFPAVTITATDEELREAALRDAFVPIIDDRGMFAGIISRDDIMQYLLDKWMKNTMVVAMA